MYIFPVEALCVIDVDQWTKTLKQSSIVSIEYLTMSLLLKVF